MPRINSPLRFDAGIEQIVVQNDALPAALPDTSRPAPGEGQITRRLDEVLSPPTVEQELIDSLRPDVVSRDMLSPPGFLAARDEAIQELTQELAKASGPEDRGVLERALALLTEDGEMRDLLDRYRGLLHRA